MLKIVGVVTVSAALVVGLSPIAFADDNTNQHEYQYCGNQPFEGLALGILGHNDDQKAEKDEECDTDNSADHEKKSDKDDDD